MKKIGVVLLVLMMVGTSVFADAGGMLFSQVPGEQLTVQEMEEAEGEGIVVVMLGGAAFGTLTYLADCLSRSVQPTWRDAGAAAAVGAIAAVNPFLGTIAGIGLSAGTSFRVGTHYIRYPM